jgi:hypothetical protein
VHTKNLDDHAVQVPWRPPDHLLPIRDNHKVRHTSPTGISKRLDHRLCEVTLAVE